METIYYLFGLGVVSAYETGGFEALKLAIANGETYSLVAYDDDMSPSELLEAFIGYEAFTEIEGDEFDELVGN
jgi:hypothetical protein